MSRRASTAGRAARVRNSVVDAAGPAVPPYLQTFSLQIRAPSRNSRELCFQNRVAALNRYTDIDALLPVRDQREVRGARDHGVV